MNLIIPCVDMILLLTGDSFTIPDCSRIRFVDHYSLFTALEIDTFRLILAIGSAKYRCTLSVTIHRFGSSLRNPRWCIQQTWRGDRLMVGQWFEAGRYGWRWLIRIEPDCIIFKRWELIFLITEGLQEMRREWRRNPFQRNNPSPILLIQMSSWS